MYLLAMFLFTYVGIGTTISGWIVTFLQIERNGTANSGYVSAGFYGGVFTFGREGVSLSS